MFFEYTYHTIVNTNSAANTILALIFKLFIDGGR